MRTSTAREAGSVVHHESIGRAQELRARGEAGRITVEWFGVGTIRDYEQAAMYPRPRWKNPHFVLTQVLGVQPWVHLAHPYASMPERVPYQKRIEAETAFVAQCSGRHIL